MTARDVLLTGYTVIAAAGIALQVAAVSGDRRVPPLGRVLSRAMRTRSGRIGMMAAWAWLGLHFFTR